MTPALLLIITILGAPPQTEPLDRALEQFQAGAAGSYESIIKFGEAAIPGLTKVLENRALTSQQRFMAANALGEIGETAAVEPLIRALADSDFNVRRCAASALAMTGDPRAVKPLEELAAKDPFTYKNTKTGELEYLVRDDAKKALASLSRAEIFLTDATKLPARTVLAGTGPPFQHLPWPFAGNFRDQNAFNNYQQPTDAYIHGGLDMLHPAGTEVRAVEAGEVALIATNYPDWKTHHFFIVVPKGKSGEGWCYTHVDPDQYQFKTGDRIARGQVLGKLVKFTVGGKPGADHLHLNYVRFEKGADGKVVMESLFDPIQYFDYDDKISPVVEPEFDFVKKGTFDEFPRGADAIPIISGKADIIVGISDAAYSGQSCNWGVPVITVEILSEKSKPWRKLVIDQRGKLGDERAASALFVKFEDSKRYPPSAAAAGVVHYYKITHARGDGLLDASDARRYWNTLQKDEFNKPRFPNGLYEITVRAWDAKGNKGERTARVRVQNKE
ncbi:MAG: HEAT repeat domain-containing protein [Planctomycetota bacterium]